MIVAPFTGMWHQHRTASAPATPDHAPASQATHPSFWQWLRAYYLKWRQPSDIPEWDKRIDFLEQRFDEQIVEMLSKKVRRR